MRKLFVLESIVKIKRKKYLLQTMEMCVPLPILNQVGPRKTIRTGRCFRYECNIIPLSDTGHPNFKKSRLVERHESQGEAVCQHKKLLVYIKKGMKLFTGNTTDDV